MFKNKITKSKFLIVSIITLFCTLFTLNNNVYAILGNISYDSENGWMGLFSKADVNTDLYGGWVDCYRNGNKKYVHFWGYLSLSAWRAAGGTGPVLEETAYRTDFKYVGHWESGTYECTSKLATQNGENKEERDKEIHITQLSYKENPSQCSDYTQAGCPEKDSSGKTCVVVEGKCTAQTKTCKDYTYTTCPNKDSYGNECDKYGTSRNGGCAYKKTCWQRTAAECTNNNSTDSYGNKCAVRGDKCLYVTCSGFSKPGTCKGTEENSPGMNSKGQKCVWDGNCKDPSSSGGGIPTPKPETYSISFNQMDGYGLNCDDYNTWSVPAPGICKKTGLTSGTEINVPKSSEVMYDSNNPSNLLIGWTKTDCNQGNIIKDSSVIITSNSEYKACYRENIGGNRYLQNNFMVEGHPSQYKCGDSIYIEYCTKEVSGQYCYYYNGNGTYVKINRFGLSANTPEGETAAKATCGSSDSSNQSSVNKYMYVITNSNDFDCGEQLYVTSCVGDNCTYNKVKKSSGSEINIDNKTIQNNYLTDDSATATKKCEIYNEDNKKCPSKSTLNTETVGIGTGKYTVCYEYKDNKTNDEIKEDIIDDYVCERNYIVDESSINLDWKNKCSVDNPICYRTYEVNCMKQGSKYKPSLEVSSDSIRGNGTTGAITVRAKSTEGRISRYYVSQEYRTPTKTTTEWEYTNSDTFTINRTPGIYYIWVEDVNGNISDGIGGAVFDTINADTTWNDFGIKDSNGGILNPLGNTAYKVEGITDSSYVRLSNTLVNDSKLADKGFNPYTMEYKIEVDTPTISVYATLTSSDSNYVSGYEPRTVSLDYGMNTVLIKIQNKEGKVRTYTILVNRVDDRTADNTLKDLSIDVGKIEFNSNKTEYKIEIPVNTEKVNVNATIGSDKASFVDGYKPGVVNIKGDTTVSLIKVKSETGSTRTYVLTFIKEGTDEIKKDNLMLFDLVIPGVYVAFEQEIANYNVSVAYETELININYDLKDSDSSASVYFKGKNDTEYRRSSNQGIKLDVGENFVEIKVINKDGEESFYRLTIIRKEFGLGISNDTTLKDLKVLGYDISYEPNKKEYTVKIKQEKSLVITAIPNSDRAEIFIRGNDELTGFSTVRVKVVAENGEFDTYSIDIKKDAFNKAIEIAAIIAGIVIILGSSCIIVIKNKNKKKKEYYEE